MRTTNRCTNRKTKNVNVCVTTNCTNKAFVNKNYEPSVQTGALNKVGSEVATQLKR